MEDYTATSNPKNATANTVWQLLEQYKKKNITKGQWEKFQAGHPDRTTIESICNMLDLCSDLAGVALRPAQEKKNQWPSLLKLAAARNKCPKNIRPLGNCPALTTGA